MSVAPTPAPARSREETEVVVVGAGWSGSIIATELARAGRNVLMLERGVGLDAIPRADGQDELRYGQRTGLTQNLADESWTLRHHLRESALPMRVGGAFRPGAGIGGAGVVWGAQSWRFLPSDFRLRSHLVERYGEAFLPAGSEVRDWGLSYEELEPDYDRFEKVAGIGGKAGNLKGELQPGGNPFEGPRSDEYPLPPMDDAGATGLFGEAADSLGLTPFPQPGGTTSRDYINPYGIARPACTYCGFCASYACHNGAKADPTVAVLPAAPAERLEIRPHAAVFLVLHDGKRATGVLYRDGEGEIRQVDAELVVLAAYTLGNVRLLLLSGIGDPYRPETGRGIVGRAAAYQAIVSATGFFKERTFARHRGSTSTGRVVDDFNADNFDHTDLGFVGGGVIQCPAGGAPPIGSLQVPPGTPAWGAEWKKAARFWYDRVASVHSQGEVIAYAGRCYDLDPTYRDRFGDPLLRLTFDWRDNDRRMACFLARRIAELLRAMGADEIRAMSELPERFDGANYQNTHNTGGAIMGASPEDSVVDSRMRCWDLPNLLVVGASSFPQNPGRNPTGTVGALAYRAARAAGEALGGTPGRDT